MKKTDIAVATISLARTDEEEKVLLDSLENLAALQFPVFLTDGGSSDAFYNHVKKLPGFTAFGARGLWPQAIRSIQESAKSGAKWILYTEPDKAAFFSSHLSTMIEAIEPANSLGVVVASRSAEAFSSFPSFQQMTETTINNCCAEIIGKKADYCYGPFLFNTQLVSTLGALPDNCGWGWRPFLFAAAQRLGYEVDSFIGDFVCPPDQHDDDEKERIYRMKQLNQNIEGLVLAASLSLQDLAIFTATGL